VDSIKDSGAGLSTNRHPHFARVDGNAGYPWFSGELARAEVRKVRVAAIDPRPGRVGIRGIRGHVNEATEAARDDPVGPIDRHGADVIATWELHHASCQVRTDWGPSRGPARSSAGGCAIDAVGGGVESRRTG